MTLKECATAAVSQAGLTVCEAYGSHDIAIHPQSEPLIFISDCTCQSHGEWRSISGNTRKGVKCKIKLTVLPPHRRGCSAADAALDILREIFGCLSLDNSFCSHEISISEAKSSAAHKRVLREAYITAVQLLPDDNSTGEADKA